MKKKRASQSGLFNPRILVAFALCSVGGLLAMLSFAATPSTGTSSLATPTALGNIQWLHPDKAFWYGGGSVEANGDGSPDVILAAGDRNAAYIGFIPGSPGFAVNLASDYAVPPVPQLLALDGLTGLPLWQVKWDAQDPLPPPPQREHFTLLEGTFTGNIDGSGPNQVLVQRSVYKAEPQGDAHSFTLAEGATLYTTMYNPSNGQIVWETQESTPADLGAFRLLYPVDVLGTPGAVLTTVSFTSPPTYTSTLSIIRFNPGGPPTTLLQLPAEPDTITYALATPYQGKLRVFMILQRQDATPQVDIRAVDVALDQNGNAFISQAWSLVDAFEKNFIPTFWGFPVVVTGGSKPTLMIGEEAVVALDVSDGHELWRSNPLGAAVAPGSGQLIKADVNRDSVEDAVFTFWTPLTPSAGLPLVPYVAAVDGRNGSRLWRSLETTGKSWGWSLNLVGVDGDGRKEVAMTGSLTDAFVFTRTPFEDQAQVSLFDLATGEQRCRFFTERLAILTFGANLDGAPGDEIVAPTVGGVVYSFAGGEPSCGPPVPLPTTPVQVTSVVSRKTHGDAGTFDVDLPTTGAHGIECRSGGANNEYTVIFTFSNALDSVNGAAITEGVGTVTDSLIDNSNLYRYIVRLSGIVSGQTVTVTLTNVHDAAGNSSSAVSASMGVLLGDTTANGVVSNTDVASVKAEVAAPVTSANFRNDVTANGIVSNTDVSAAKAQVGTLLP
jgi:hypothetical protein